MISYVLLTTALEAVKKRGLVGDEQSGFPSRDSTTLPLTRLIEGVDRGFNEKPLSGVVFLDANIAFDTLSYAGMMYLTNG